MRNDAAGTTDVLSSLPIIACCIFAVMMLVAAIGQSAGRDGREGLEGPCGELLDEALRNLTAQSEDGRRYLYMDWEERAGALRPAECSDALLTSSIEVRLLGVNSSELILHGNLSSCREVFSEGAPVLLVSGRCTIPGEIVARVGR